MKKPRLLILTLAISITVICMISLRKEINDYMEEKINVKEFNSFIQFSSNVYIISSNKGNILIDPGHYDFRMRNYIDKIGGLDAILLTHGHWDHIYGLNDLEKDYPNTPIYISDDDYDFLTNPSLNCSNISLGENFVINSKANAINEGELDIKGYKIDVISTPGHTKGSVMYYFKDENILFTGDTIMKDLIGPTYRPTGSDDDMRYSISKFKKLGYDLDTPVYPGHRDITTYGYILNNNKYVKENYEG